MAKLTYKIYTLGCKVNQYDSIKLGERMELAGMAESGGQADLAVINTCAVTKTAIRKCKRMLNKARQESPGAKLVLMGCWPKAYREEAENMGADIVWGVGDQDEMVRRIPAILGNKNVRTNAECGLLNAETDIRKSRYFIKIQDGCEQFCSYCIIPHTRGKMRSRPENEVIAEIEQAVRSGYKEIVLSGIHLGLYGKEGRNSKDEVRSSLNEILLRIIGINGLGRVRLSSIEVNEVGDDLIALIARSNKICKHLHIPLQSGSDKILKLMKRPYTSGYFLDRIEKIRQAVPEIALTTDVIVGFPGEGDEEFKETLATAEKAGFSKIHVFPFSAHEKTLAAKMPGQVDKKTKQERAGILRKISKKYEAEYKKKFTGKELAVVVENKTGDSYNGKSEYYFDISFNSDRQLPVGSIVRVNNQLSKNQ